jgi:hypothetical protein
MLMPQKKESTTILGQLKITDQLALQLEEFKNLNFEQAVLIEQLINQN